MNVAIILWRCFHTTFCGNVVATPLKLSWDMLQQLHVPRFSQLSLNEYGVEATSGGNIFTTVAQHLSSVPGLRCSNVGSQPIHFHNFRSTLWQRSRNFPGIWVYLKCICVGSHMAFQYTSWPYTWFHMTCYTEWHDINASRCIIIRQRSCSAARPLVCHDTLYIDWVNIFIYLLHLNKAALYKFNISGQTGNSYAFDLRSINRHTPDYAQDYMSVLHWWCLQN